MKRFVPGFATLLSLALAGCGGNAGAPEQSAASVVQVGGASGTELAERQVIHIGNAVEIQTLDPHRGEEIAGSNVTRDLYEGLVGEASNGDLEPGAAASWTLSDDGRVYTFKLRSNGRWSNGDPVTAEDFVFGMRRAVDPATRSIYTFILTPILHADDVATGKLPPTELAVRALDDLTLEITLENPTPYFLGLLTHSMTFPVHRESLERHGEQFTRPGNLVTNGAFQLAEWVVQSHIKLVRNHYYWDDANVRLEELWFYPTEDQTAELQRYRAGELDWTDIVPASQLKWVRENLLNELVIAPYLGSYFFGFNNTKPPFKDNLNLRRALSLAINRHIIAEQVLGAGQIPAFGWVPPVANYMSQQLPEANWTQEQREAEAKRLYAAAGYSAENPLRTEIIYNTQENHRRVSLAMAAMWKQVLGVETKITNQEWKVFIDTRNRREETQVYRHGWIGDYNDAFTFAELWRSTSGQNDIGYYNAEYDRLVTAAQSELDLAKRADLLQQAERVLLADMPLIPIYYYVTSRLIKPWVKGYSPNIMDHHRHKYFYILKH